MLKSKLWRGIVCVLAVLLSFSIFMTVLLNKWSGQVNLFLGLTAPTASVTDDTNYYASDYDRTDAGYLEMQADSDAHDVQTMVEGAVLVKNDNNALPLTSGERSVTLFGRSTADPVYRGNSGGPTMDSSRLVSLKSALEDQGFEINETMYNAYASSGVSRTKVAVENDSGIKSSIGEVDISFYTSELKNSYSSQYNDVAIVMFSRDGGEGMDLFTTDADGVSQLALHQQEADLLKMIKSSGKFNKVIVLINSAYAMELGWVEQEEYGVDACVWIGGTGLKGFEGVAELLVGEADFSGHFVDTYATDSLSSAAVQNSGDISFTNGGNYIVEAEGIYVGYKYYETRYQDQVLGINNATGTAGTFASTSGWNYAEEMAYPYGYGLSYAQFTQEVKSVDWDTTEHTVTVEVEVTNEGYPSGCIYTGKSKSVVQLYVQLPYESGMAEKSAIQLVDFAKTDELGEGESQTVTITCSDYIFATYDEDRVNGADTSKTGCYVFDEGDYYFTIGDNCHDALNNVLAARGESGMTDQYGNTVTGDSGKAYKVTLGTADTTTYATSQYTGEVVSNQFDDIDINEWIDDAVTYLTRDDWNTFPITYDSLTATSAMQSQMNDTSYDTLSSAPSYSSYTQGEDAGLTLVEMRDVDYDDEKWETFLNQLSVSDMTAVVGENFGQSAVTSVGKPANTNSDGPAGPQAGYTGESITGSSTVRVNEVVAASTWNKQILSDRGSFIGEDCLFGGTTQLWAPGCNIHRTPFSGRNFEYYSEDSVMSYICSSVQCAAMQAKGVNAAPKHFTGNDQETNRTGLCTYMTEQAFRQGPLKGFEGAFTEGGALGTMMACSYLGNHLVYSYSNLLTNVLRDEWGFKGITITDSVASWSSTQGSTLSLTCLVAGTDTFNARQQSGSDIKTYVVSNKDGYILSKLRDANHHFYYAMSRSNLINGLTADSEVSDWTPWWQTALVAIEATVGTLTALAAAMYVFTYIREWRNKRNG